MALGVMFTNGLKIIFQIKLNLRRWMINNHHIKTFFLWSASRFNIRTPFCILSMFTTYANPVNVVFYLLQMPLLIYLSNSDLNILYAETNIVMNDLYNWFCANKLSLNANQTNYLTIRPPHRP